MIKLEKNTWIFLRKKQKRKLFGQNRTRTFRSEFLERVKILSKIKFISVCFIF
jgi:hypothetical protein